MIDEKDLIKDIKECKAMREFDWTTKTLISLLESAPKVSQWIPASERLPGDREIVLQVTIKRLKDDYTWVQSLLWDYDKWKWWEEDDKKVDASRFKILAWQSLPESYKEENYD